MQRVDRHVRVEVVRRLFRDSSFRPLDMLLRKEELSVQIRQVDSIQVNLLRRLSLLLSNEQLSLSLTISIFLNPAVTTFLSSSQPIPPAPTSRIRLVSSFEKSSAFKMRFAYVL